MDKFPEAFKRFEQVVDTRRIDSFSQLRLEFGLWAGRRWKDTSKQRYALAREAQEQGIPVSLADLRRGREISPIRVRTWSFQRTGRTVHVLRDSKGRFVSERAGISGRARLRAERKGYTVVYVDQKIGKG